MASFAKLENNIVERVESVVNEVIKDSNGVEQEQLGINFLKTLYNEPNAFISPKPYNSWILNETTCNWDAPVAYPNDGQFYKWNEEILNWELING